MVNGARVIPKHVKSSADPEASNRTSYEDTEREEIVDIRGNVSRTNAVVSVDTIGEYYYCADEMRIDVAGLVV